MCQKHWKDKHTYWALNCWCFVCRELPLTCSFEEYLTCAAGFTATQVYSPECDAVRLEMLSKLEYGSRAEMLIPDFAETDEPSLSQLISRGGSP